MPFDLNLLPQSRRAALARQSIIASVHRFLVSITMGLLLLTLVGVSSFGVLQSIIRTLSHEKEAQLHLAVSQYDALQQSVDADNAFLAFVADLVRGRREWGEKVYDLLTGIPGGIRIHALRGQGEDKPTLSFSGQAATRNALTVLEQRLKSISWVQSVDAPNSNLIDRTNAPYEFILSFK